MLLDGCKTVSMIEKARYLARKIADSSGFEIGKPPSWPASAPPSVFKKIANRLGFDIYRPPSWRNLTPPSLPRKIANSLGFEIYRPPNLWHALTPPTDIRNLVGPFSNAYYYAATGQVFFEYFKGLCGLKPDEDVLDVGCGCGQMAAPLTRYLNSTSMYEGFDIVPESTKWAELNISSRYPNFHFHMADVFNQSFHPAGQCKASEYRFPYNNESFDFIFLKSVFTHMLPQDMENYFSEICRVLRKGRRCLITYFLLNTQSLAQIKANASTQDFQYVFSKYRTTSETAPEGAIAYDETYIRGLYSKFGLDITGCLYGSWSGRKDFLNYQDIIVASKVT